MWKNINNHWRCIKIILTLYFKIFSSKFSEIKQIIKLTIQQDKQNINKIYILFFILIIIHLLFVFLIYPMLVLYGWNLILVSLFHVSKIGYLWAFLISCLINIIYRL